MLRCFAVRACRSSQYHVAIKHLHKSRALGVARPQRALHRLRQGVRLDPELSCLCLLSLAASATFFKRSSLRLATPHAFHSET